MTATVVTALMVILTISAAIALWHSAASINHMTAQTHDGIRWAYVFKASGYFVQILAVFDYAHGDPLAWPWLLLAGIAISNSGAAVLHVVTRRTCQCNECPIRIAPCPLKDRND